MSKEPRSKRRHRKHKASKSLDVKKTGSDSALLSSADSNKAMISASALVDPNGSHTSDTHDASPNEMTTHSESGESSDSSPPSSSPPSSSPPGSSPPSSSPPAEPAVFSLSSSSGSHPTDTLQATSPRQWTTTKSDTLSKLTLSATHAKTSSSPRDPAEIIFNAYKDELLLSELFCLNELEKEWGKSQPFKNKKILMNGHMTLITLVLIRLLILGGAEVDTTAYKLVTHQNTLAALREAHINFFAADDKGDVHIPVEKQNGYYDLIFDCGAGMLSKVKPKKGGSMIELTKTDQELYTKINFPVISVDTSSTKEIETYFGTGESLVRVINQLCTTSMEQQVGLNEQLAEPNMRGRLLQIFPTLKLPNNIQSHVQTWLAMIEPNKIYSSYNYMIFGYGKVGQGIVAALEKANVPKTNIHIVEANAKVVSKLRRGEYKVYGTDEIANNKDLIKEKKIFAAITATGIEGVISKYFDAEHFIGVAHKINMGTPDEWGHKFSKEEVLNEKRPANFSLNFPTSIRYLDPIFALLLKAGERSITQTGQKKPGFSAVDTELDTNILGKWEVHHGQTGSSLWTHQSDQERVRQFLADLRARATYIDHGLKSGDVANAKPGQNPEKKEAELDRSSEKNTTFSLQRKKSRDEAHSSPSALFVQQRPEQKEHTSSVISFSSSSASVSPSGQL